MQLSLGKEPGLGGPVPAHTCVSYLSYREELLLDPKSPISAAPRDGSAISNPR